MIWLIERVRRRLCSGVRRFLVEFVEIEKTFAVPLMLHGVGDGVERAARLSAGAVAREFGSCAR